MGFWGTVGDSFAEGWWMFYDTLWALVLGFGLSGAVQAFVSKGEMQRVLGDHRPRTVARSTFFGMVSSSCSYAASALSKSLFARGADFTSSMVFMFASTNLVVELGIVLWLLIGWQFALAEFVGGAIMIAILAVVLPRVVNVPELDAARQRLRAGKAGSDDGHEGHAAMAEEQHTAKPWRERIRSRAGWSDASGYTISDVTMLRKELVIGYVIAGFAAIAVPVSVWEAVFLSGHGFWSVLENVIVGPVIAFISFVCSVGNVPLAAALWKGGISFGGVIAFIFADLLALPLVLIYRKFYGTRLAVKLSLVFWATMSLAGLLTEGIFQLARLIPTERRDEIAVIHFGWNYTTVLNALAVHRVAGTRLGELGELALVERDGEQQEQRDAASSAVDPVCGMSVDPATAASADHAGRTYYFCSDGCRSTFRADPLAHLTVARDPVCGMDVTVASPGASATIDGTRYVFCMQGCADAFTADAGRYLSQSAGASR
ncbi:MAG: permease [Actinobacteria bacterium]|nr:permease [Actinomycetota bacterium]